MSALLNKQKNNPIQKPKHLEQVNGFMSIKNFGIVDKQANQKENKPIKI